MKTFAELSEAVRGYRMTEYEKRAQAIDFSVGNLLIDRAGEPGYDEWDLRRYAAKAYDKRHGG